MSRPSASTPLNADPRVATPDTTKITRYRTIDVDGLKLFYREAGASEAPALLLLHGFPDLVPYVSRPYSGARGPLPCRCAGSTGLWLHRSARSQTLQVQLRAFGRRDRAVHGGCRPQPLRPICFRLRRTNWISPSHSPSRSRSPL